MNHKYRFKFYINARHSVNFSGIQSEIHPHTWEVVMYINVHPEMFINFTEIENKISNYFEKYEGKYLNDLEDFKAIEPTMENITVKVFEDLKRSLGSKIDIDRVEVSENPTRTYIIEQ